MVRQGLPVTSAYAGALGLVFGALTVTVIGRRRASPRGVTALGDGGDQVLAARVRAHGNFAEFVPLNLTLMALLELGRAVPNAVLHGLGGLLLVSRLLHASSFFVAERRVFPTRFSGILSTVGCLVTSSVLCVLQGTGIISPAAAAAF